ncbi:MAG: polymorphic toxin-type HINT domain-containing protein, partial [Fimbriiglobus sp.]
KSVGATIATRAVAGGIIGGVMGSAFGFIDGILSEKTEDMFSTENIERAAQMADIAGLAGSVIGALVGGIGAGLAAVSCTWATIFNVGVASYGVHEGTVGAIDAWESGNEKLAIFRGLGVLASIYMTVKMARSCFVTGTPLMTPFGSKPIEEFVESDEILSRSEFDPNGPVVVRRVIRVFRRTAQVLTVASGGAEIGTAAEHPFWAVGRGWTKARELAVGDRLVGHDGTETRVDRVTDTGRYEVVYNVEVEEDHTYFVGADALGRSVWAHNADCLPTPREALHGATDHHNAMNGQAALHQAGRAHPAMPVDVRVQSRLGPGGVMRAEVRTNQAPINPANIDGPPLQAGVPSTGGRYNVRPDVQVLGTDGRVYVTEITRRLPNGNIDTRYHNDRILQLQSEYGSAWGGYHHIDIP